MQADSAAGEAAGGQRAHLEEPQCGRGAAQPPLHETLPTSSAGGDSLSPGLNAHPFVCVEGNHVLFLHAFEQCACKQPIVTPSDVCLDTQVMHIALWIALQFRPCYHLLANIVNGSCMQPFWPL